METFQNNEIEAVIKYSPNKKISRPDEFKVSIYQTFKEKIPLMTLNFSINRNKNITKLI